MAFMRGKGKGKGKPVRRGQQQNALFKRKKFCRFTAATSLPTRTRSCRRG